MISVWVLSGVSIPNISHCHQQHHEPSPEQSLQSASIPLDTLQRAAACRKLICPPQRLWGTQPPSPSISPALGTFSLAAAGTRVLLSVPVLSSLCHTTASDDQQGSEEAGRGRELRACTRNPLLLSTTGWHRARHLIQPTREKQGIKHGSNACALERQSRCCPAITCPASAQRMHRQELSLTWPAESWQIPSAGTARRCLDRGAPGRQSLPEGRAGKPG